MRSGFTIESPGEVGDFVALNRKTGKPLWRHKTLTPMTSAVLTTGGGLVVVGDWDRNLYVHDAETGEMLFQTRLSSAIQGFPITYSVRGKQYLAIPVGMGSPRAVWATRILPEKKAPPPGNGLFVFSLPDRASSPEASK